MAALTGLTRSSAQIKDLVLAQIRPNLILLDIMMPELDGLELCRRLKARPQA